MRVRSRHGYHIYPTARGRVSKDNMSNNSQGAVNSGRGKAKENNKGKKNNPRKTREEKMVRSET